MGGEGRAGADGPLGRTQLAGEEGGQVDHMQGDHSCSPADEMRSTFYVVRVDNFFTTAQILGCPCRTEPIKCYQLM